MGNTLAPLDIRKTKRFDGYLANYPKLLNKELLSDSKLFKTYSFLAEGESYIIMKVYFKRDNLSLKSHEASLAVMQKEFNLNKYPNLLPYTRFIDEPEFAALIRPKVHISLSNKMKNISSLTQVEKEWIIFQLITAVYNLHRLKLYHGYITSNNIMLTTWNHVFLADFAWYAPNYIYEDKLDDITFYYPFSLKRCNFAPEKLIQRGYNDDPPLQWTQDNVNNVNPNTLVSLQKMDVFSLGCIIAEIMLNGTALFSYEQLLDYRRNKYSPEDKLDKIEDLKIRCLIHDMIKRDPNERSSIENVLELMAHKIAHKSFSNLIYYIDSSFVSYSFTLPDQKIALIRELLDPIYKEVLCRPLIPHYEHLPIPIQHCQVLKHFRRYYGAIEPNFYHLLQIETPGFLKQSEPLRTTLEFIQNINLKSSDDIQLANLLRQKQAQNDKELQKLIVKGQHNALVIIVLMICTSIRHVRYFSSMLVALEMLKNFSQFLSDHVNLHMIIPYLFSLLDEQNPKIMVAAFNTACTLLYEMKKPIRTKADRRLFEDYILPNLLKTFQSQDVYVRTAFVERLYQIVEMTTVFVTESGKLGYVSMIENNDSINNKLSKKSVSEPPKKSVSAVIEDDDYNHLESIESPLSLQRASDGVSVEVDKMRMLFIEYIQEIVASPHQELHEALLENFSKLAFALGPEFTENFLIPHIIAGVNNSKSKFLSLRELEILIDLISGRTVNDLLKPVLEKCMFDTSEMNVFQSVKNIVRAMKLKKLSLNDPITLIETYLPLLVHPNGWIRGQVVQVFCLVLDNMDPYTLYLHLQPALHKYMKGYENFHLLNSELLKLALVEPLSRRAFDEVRTQQVFDSIKEPQMIDLAAILVEHFFSQIVTESDQSIRKIGFKGSYMRLDPLKFKNFSNEIQNFCEQTNVKHIQELLIPNNTKILSESILIEADKGNQLPHVAQENKEELRSLEQIKALRDKLLVRMPDLLLEHNISFLTYIKNLHNFCIFSADILEKVGQLKRRKDKDLGCHERFERSIQVNKAWEPNGFLVKTIYEHSDSVNCLEASLNGKMFASASDDGKVKIFDIAKIETDFSCSSVSTLTVGGKNHNEDTFNLKVKALKFLDDDLLVAGTTMGSIGLYQLEDASEKDKHGLKKPECLRRFEVDGEVKSLQSLILGNAIKEKSFIYVTHKGELGIQDINQKSASLRFNLGKEKGMISTMFMSAMDYTVLIGTVRGYVMLYDIRANLLTSVYKLNRETPILSFTNYHPIEPGLPISQEVLTGVSFGSDFHEVGFWNFNEFHKENKNPDIYFHAAYSSATECNPNYLKDCSKSESLFNVKNSFKARVNYEYLNVKPSMYDILSFYSDSISYSQELQRERWLSDSKNIYDSHTRAFQYTNSARKIVCLPSLSCSQLRHPGSWHRDAQNIVFTAGNDMNIRYWNLSNDKCYQVHSMDGERRTYKLTDKKIKLYQEVVAGEPGLAGFSGYQFVNGYKLDPNKQSNKNILTQAGHRDQINDILVMDKNEMVVTCSRDKTIKVWK